MDQKHQGLIMCNSINSNIEILDIYGTFLISAVKNHHQENVYSHEEADAKIVLHMMLTKILYLKKSLEGISFSNKKVQLESIIDPTIVGILVRNIYETAGLFSLIYRHSKRKEERQIKYLLWVHSGLSYRQRLESHNQSTENAEKLQEEKKEMEQIASMIKNNSLYQSLRLNNQKKIETRLEKKEYLIQFHNDGVKVYNWTKLYDAIGLQSRIVQENIHPSSRCYKVPKKTKINFFKNIYSYFSLFSHPSHASVFQFKNMFSKKNREFEELTNFGIKYAFYMTSIFIADYLHFFPQVKPTFDSLDKNHQGVIDFYNTLVRGQDYSIFQARYL